MSKLYDMRAGLKSLIAAANIGWTEDTILIKRQGSFWNDVATAIGNAENGAVLHIGIAEGKRTDDESLEYDLTVPITIICSPQVDEDAMPEEDLWENLVGFLDDLRITTNNHVYYRLIAGDFLDIDIQLDGGTSYLGRQTTFRRKLSL